MKFQDWEPILHIWVDMGGGNYVWLDTYNFYPKVGEILAKYGDPGPLGVEL